MDRHEGRAYSRVTKGEANGELDTDEAGSLMGIKTWASGLKLF